MFLQSFLYKFENILQIKSVELRKLLVKSSLLYTFFLFFLAPERNNSIFAQRNSVLRSSCVIPFAFFRGLDSVRRIIEDTAFKIILPPSRILMGIVPIEKCLLLGSIHFSTIITSLPSNHHWAKA